MSLRLTPLNKFHEYLCGLNYYTDFNEDIYNAEVNEEEQDTKIPEELPEVPLIFENVDDYIRVWQSLFFVEAKAQIKKEELAETQKSEIFLLKAIEKLDNFLLFVMIKEKASELSYITGDVVLVCHQTPETPHPEHVVGIVESASSTDIKVKTYLDIQSKDPRTVSIINLLLENSQWHVKRICNIATLNREYQAIHSVPDLNLKDILVNPKENRPSKSVYSKNDYFDIPDVLNEKLQSMYNFSQYQAIRECLKKEGITLIQGPPGTGKTTTILGVLSVLLNSRNKLEKFKTPKVDISQMETEFDSASEKERMRLFKRAMPWAYESNYEDWREDRDNFNTLAPYKDRKVLLPPLKEDTTSKPEKILICAPSNAAIDEIIRKMITIKQGQGGLLDEEGKNYIPNIVRIGPNYHPSLKHYSLEYLIEREKEARGDAEYENIKNDILKKAQIICSTLSVTGSSLLTSNYQRFDTVVIDEAAQAVEISTLIPLKYDCKRLIMIGDPKQLPATIFSTATQRKKYDQSMFHRFQLAGYPVHLLQVQYRMHPQISSFISSAFYESKLQDYEKIMDLIGKPSLYEQGKLAPITFFDVKGSEESVGNTKQNDIEAKFVVKLYAYLSKTLPDFDRSKFGIITPYNGQAALLREYVKENDKTLFSEVEVNSVDGFQGREKDIIIFSTVRTNKKSIGFLSDVRRMNVGLSRARLGLIIVGDAEKLRFCKKGGKKWKLLVNYCIQNNRCIRVPDNFLEIDFLSEFAKDPNKYLQKEADSVIEGTLS